MWGWPQWVYAGLMVFGVLRGLAKDGDPDGKVNAGMSIAAAMVCAWLLWMGGFWT